VKSREMYFATYQSMAQDERRPGLYQEFPQDFFDLIVIDECHRGSARQDSSWREILEYFEPAFKLGMTATPLREENRDTYAYFGNPLYTYSLKQGKRTAETALLFLQLIMRKLKRPVNGSKGGRCGMVVPNGVLFGDGSSARIKDELLKEFNLHTIVRLPNGVFSPYTSIPTNLLFFDRSKPTERVWFYEQPLPEGRKNYTKSSPIQFEEFSDCLAWWKKREQSERAWCVPVAQLFDANCNLDRKNPRAKEDITHLPPEQLVEDVLQKEQRIGEIMLSIKALLASHIS
jgi:type I restriction-modification system DNA methylase subunit